MPRQNHLFFDTDSRFSMPLLMTVRAFVTKMAKLNSLEAIFIVFFFLCEGVGTMFAYSLNYTRTLSMAVHGDVLC